MPRGGTTDHRDDRKSEDMRLRGRVGGFIRASRYSPDELTGAARAGFMARFVREVDERDPGLPEAERRRRATALLNAHMSALARKSALSRASRSKPRQ